MPGLHLPLTPYDLFVYNFCYDFSGIVDGYALWPMCFHCIPAMCIFLCGLLVTRAKPYGDHAEILQKLCSLCSLRTEIVQSLVASVRKSDHYVVLGIGVPKVCNFTFLLELSVKMAPKTNSREIRPRRKMLTIAKWLHGHGAVMGLPQDNCFLSVQLNGHCTGTVRQPCDSCVVDVRLSQEPTIIVQFLFGPNDHLKSCIIRMFSMRPLCGARVGIVRCYL